MDENHGNRLRPIDEAYEVKKERSRRAYEEAQMKLNPCWLNEKILREQYNLYGPNHLGDLIELYNKGFDLRIYSRKIEMNGVLVLVMKKHGFSLDENGKLIVWKI